MPRPSPITTSALLAPIRQRDTVLLARDLASAERTAAYSYAPAAVAIAKQQIVHFGMLLADALGMLVGAECPACRGKLLHACRRDGVIECDACGEWFATVDGTLTHVAPCKDCAGVEPIAALEGDRCGSCHEVHLEEESRERYLASVRPRASRRSADRGELDRTEAA